MYLNPPPVVRREVLAERSQQAHQVRRAAGAAQPLLTFVSTPAEQRVHVEEVLAIQREAAEHAVIKLSLDDIGIAAVARDLQHAPVPEDAANRRSEARRVGLERGRRRWRG